MKKTLISLTLFISVLTSFAQQTINQPWIWPSEPPAGCPFPQSEDIVGIAFTGVHSNYHGLADTWHPSWASDDKMYSPYADGCVPRLDGSWDCVDADATVSNGKKCTTGQAVMEGNDPLNLKIYSMAPSTAKAEPYAARYPSGSLVYNGVWYYGTYCVDPPGGVKYGDTMFGFAFLGPFVGFRLSKDYGRSWIECPHTPEKPIFGENGKWGYPVKIGIPFFVDFGKNMEHSPDGKAYLTAFGASPDDPSPRFANTSWATGDQVYLLRVDPSPEKINDPAQYEFFGGHKKDGTVLWVNKLSEAKPLLEWNNRMGPALVTYDAPLKKYLMCVTDGVTVGSYMNTYILESDNLTGPWKMVTFMKHFGEQAYEAVFPSRFISSDGKTLWMCYSAYYSPKEWNSFPIKANPPGGEYGLVLQEVKLLNKKKYEEYKNNPKLKNSEQELFTLNTWKFKSGDNLEWAKPGFNDSQWKPIEVGSHWEAQGYAGYDGYAWYRITFRLPSELKKKITTGSICFSLGKIDDHDQTFLNGQLLGQNTKLVPAGNNTKVEELAKTSMVWDVVREYIIPINDPRLKWDQDNVIAVRVYDEIYNGGLYNGGVNISIGKRRNKRGNNITSYECRKR